MSVQVLVQVVLVQVVLGLVALEAASEVAACFVDQMVSRCIAQTDPFAHSGSASFS